MAKSLLERFEEKYIPEPNSGCWLWTAYLRPDGYGEISKGRRGEGTILAHRASYQMFAEPIPDNLELDHLCRNRCCVNPEHLEPVTRLENTMRGDLPDTIRFVKAAITHCPHGHEYTVDNTYIVTKTARGYHNRMCRACARVRTAMRRKSAREC